MAKGLKSSSEKSLLNQVQNNLVKRKLLTFSSILALAVITLFFISPVMAKVSSQMPYLSQYVKQEEQKDKVFDLIVKVSAGKDYKIRGIEGSVLKKEIILWIAGSKESIKNKKDDVKRNINQTLESKGYGTFDIKIKQYRGKKRDIAPKLTAKEEQFMKASQELEKRIIEQLKKHNYVTAFPVQVRINSREKFIYVAVPKTEKRTDELKNLLRSTSKEYGEFKMRLTKIDMKAREQEIRWGKNFIVSTIGNGLMANKDFKVTTYSYSFHPYPLQLEIKTSIKSTNPNAEKLAEKIEKEIEKFIKVDETTKEVRNDPYVLTIYSKDKKKIN